MVKVNYKDVLDFWYDPANRPNWFAKDENFDKELYDRFYEVWKSGCEGLLSYWRVTLEGRLAEIIVLDQFSRNLCRDKGCAFSQDKMALVLSQEAINQDGFDDMTNDEKKFMIMPFMHSESAEIHKESVSLFEKLGDELSTDYAYKHKEIIDRFGRYPHRNNALNRKSTEEEEEFLKQPGSSF